MSLGEQGAERDENRLAWNFLTQEVHAKKPANTGDFGRSRFGKRDLSKGQLAEGKVLETNSLGGEKRISWYD